MIQIRSAADRGRTELGWLDSRHTFSFGDYYDPGQAGFRALRVINDDRVAPGQGFGTHPHRDMEIITYVLEGALEHRDSLGTGSVIQPGELQRMSAGTGIRHSEFNASATQPVHLYQIWLLPRSRGISPSYEQKKFPLANGQWSKVASPDGADGSLRIHQDASLFLANLEKEETVWHALQPGRHAWVQVLRGRVTVNGQPLSEGDGAALTDEAAVSVGARAHAEVMLFDLA